MNEQLHTAAVRILALVLCGVLALGGLNQLRAQEAFAPSARIEIKGGKVVKVEQQSMARPDGFTDENGRVIRPRKFDTFRRESDQPMLLPGKDVPGRDETERPESEMVPSLGRSGTGVELTINGEPYLANAEAKGEGTDATPGTVDLLISSVSVLDATGPGIKFRFVIGNNGPDPVTTNFQNHIYLSTNTTLDPDWDHYLTNYWCNDDIAGYSSHTTADLSFTVETVPDGSYYLGVKADGSYLVSEERELNNWTVDTTPLVTIVNPGTRDLDVLSVEVLDETGPSIGYRYTIINHGTGIVLAGFETEVYLSSNTIISTSDHLIAAQWAPSPLGAGRTYMTPNLTREVSGVPDGRYYLGVITDASGVVTETNETNNTGYDSTPLVTISGTGTYDLDVVSVEVLDATGPEIQFRYTVRNNGSGMVFSGVTNDVYLSSNTAITTTDHKIASYKSASDLAAGGSYTTGDLTRTVSGVPDGSYYLGVMLDGPNEITETSETNNTGYDSSPQVTLSTPYTFDLDVSSVEVLDATGPGVTFRYTIVNHGTGAVTVSFANQFYLSANTTISTGDHLIGTRWTSADIAAGGSYTSADLDYVISGVPDGSYYLGVITDASGLITESNEVNNTGYDNSPLVAVSAAMVIDLSVSSVEVIDATGPDITFRYTIANAGTGEAASGFENHIYLSVNTAISPSDHLIDTWASGQPVPAGGSYTSRELACTVVGVPDGTYYLGVITDGGGNVEETNESNNSGHDSSPQVTISSSRVYDLYVSSVEVVEGTCPDIQYRYTVGNNGSDAVPMGFENRVYLSDNTTISTTDHLIDTRISSENVPAGGTYTSVNLSCTVSGVPDGTYYVGVIVDAPAAVDETNEGNNSGYDNAHQLTVSSTGIEPVTGALPARFQLLQNYPNPFNPSTTIEFQLPWESDVRLAVFNALGQEVEELVSGRLPAGVFRTRWQASHVAAGVYYGRLVAKPLDMSRGGNGHRETVRMILVK